MSEDGSSARRRGRPSTGADGGEVQSLDRAMSILQVLAGDDGITMSEVGRRAGLPTSTVHRLLATLQRRALVAHDASSGLWTVGVGLFRIGSAYLRIRRLPDIARPVLRDLLAESGETANLTILQDGALVCALQAETHRPLRAFFRVGMEMPIHACAAGKAVLAAASPTLYADLVAELDYEKLTDRTPTDERGLARLLGPVRKRGFARDEGEHMEGLASVAAAVTDEAGEPLGAVSVSAPLVRMPAEHAEALGARLLAAADTITALYCGRESREDEAEG